MPRWDPELREDAIRAAVHDGHQVVIAPYTHVSEGLNLQHEFESVIWVEMAQSHFLRDQASRRIWRLGKEFDPSIPAEAREVRVYYLVYKGSGGHKKLHKLGQQNGAAILFAGDTPDGELVKQAGADHTALAKMSRDLHRLDDEGGEVADDDLDATFARRNDERYATLQRGRDWIGVVDTLAARLAAFRASVLAPTAVTLDPVPELEPEEVLEAAPVPAPIAPPSTEPHVEQHGLFDPIEPPKHRHPARPQSQAVVVQQLTLW